MKIKSSIRKKLLTSLLIGATLSGVVNSTAFALDNLSTNSSVNGLSRSYSLERQYTVHEIANGKKIYHLYYLNDYLHYVFIKFNNKLYLYDMTSDCFLTGLITFRGHKFYFDTKRYYAVTGWYNTGGHRYYFRPDTFSTPNGGFYTVGNTRYLFSNDGYILTGLNKVDGKTYYTNKVGALVTGWYSMPNGDRYYFNPNDNGAAYTGWYQDLSSGRYLYFHDDGRMAKGLTTIKGNLYLFLSKGRDQNCYRQNGFYSAPNGARYYFDPSDGDKAYINKWLKTPDGYVYFKGDGTMARGVTRIGNETYVFVKRNLWDLNSYRALGWYTDTHSRNYDRYYFGGPLGQALTGHQVIDGKQYDFNDYGILINGPY